MLTEDDKRIYRRKQAKKGNYNLNRTALKSGVKDLARFHNADIKDYIMMKLLMIYLKKRNLDIEKIY